jgi:thiosulfate/3-mercaptopyruvate sulfurtransferase
MLNALNEISTGELLRLLDREETRVIDVRPADAYNGWPLHNEPRGGHIKNARSLPLKWINYLDWIEIVRRKQILPEHRIVVYGYQEADSFNVGTRFLESGYHHVSVYNRFVKEWLVNPNLPMQRLERFRNLVPASWINALISNARPLKFSNRKYVVVHAHYRNREAYLSGHIPGAIDMDTVAIEAPEMWNRRNPQELKKALEDHGITANTTVVLYGKFMSPDINDPFPGSAAGDIGAMRCAFVIMYAGVKDVRVLNGGFQSWKDEGFEISYADEPKRKVPEFGATIPVHPEYVVDIHEARQILVSSDAELVCVRSWPEFIGEVSGYNYFERKGRIPGAIFADCGSDAYHMENYRNIDQTGREYHEIANNWIKSGITPDKHLAFYCGTGWRGSEAWFNAWLMGWPRVSVFDGGWLEWSSDPANPVETGVPPSTAVVNGSLFISDLRDQEGGTDIISEIFTGLSAIQKYLSSRFFYDDAGSALFEEITGLPEYYLTRTEKSILKEAAPQILNLQSFNSIVELGSGDCSKISILLDAFQQKIAEIEYVPVDISKTSIEKSAGILTMKYPGIRIHGILTDFINHFKVIPCDGSKLICFFGSNFGNLSRTQEIPFLKNLKSWMNPGDQLLIGFDMVKDIKIMEKAYNDEQGKTAAFNGNMLNVVNHYSKTNFNPEQFDHYSFYDIANARIEMHLRALENIEVCSPYMESKICFNKGETIHTESCYKYETDYIYKLAEISGLQIKDIYTDTNGWFSLAHFIFFLISTIKHSSHE